MINIQNIQNIDDDDDDDDDDDECCKWCLVRYLHPVDFKQARITKANKDFSKRPDFTDIKDMRHSQN